MEDNTPKNPEVGPTPTPDPVVNPTVTTPEQPTEPTSPVVSEAPVEPVVAAPAPVESGRKGGSKKGLLIGLVVLVVLLVGGYFGLKAWADSAATTYFDKIETELKDAPVGDALNSLSSSTASVEKAREETKEFREDVVKPASVPLGSVVSSKYKDAKDVEERLDSFLGNLEEELANIEGVLAFGNLLRESTSYVNSSTVPSTLRNNAEKLEEISDELRELTLTGTASDIRTKYADAYDKFAEQLNKAADAAEAQNVTAYRSAASEIVSISQEFRSLQSETSGLQSDLRERFEPLGEEADSLKETIEKYTK